MTVVISDSVGADAANKPTDTARIDVALEKVGMLGSFCPTDATRVRAIQRFQEIWGLGSSKGLFDGRIDKSGRTLARLNQTLEPLTLRPIKAIKIANGGYEVRFSPSPPPKPYQLWFGPTADPNDYLDVTGASSSAVITSKNLPDLLKLIKRRATWGQSLFFKLFVTIDGKIVSESAPQCLWCPVQPHNGKLLPLDESANGAALIYQGDSEDGPFYGRMFEQINDYPDAYFFKYGGVFETDVKHRGFDCITYAGTTCGGSTSHMAESSDLAKSLGTAKCTIEKTVPPAKTASKVELENTDPQNVKDFFKNRTTGNFLMYSGGHVVLVIDGTVHEFCYSKPGYRATAVGDWLAPYKTKKLTVRELSAKPVLAT